MTIFRSFEEHTFSVLVMGCVACWASETREGFSRERESDWYMSYDKPEASTGSILA